MNYDFFEKIDKSCKTPVYQAVRKQIKSFIDSSPDNTLFPPERKLSEIFGVNRRTLRKAIEPLSVFLVRGPMGTVIRKQPFSSSEFAIDKIHSQLFNNVSFGKVKKVVSRIGIYENLPSQQKFWTEIIEDFNKSNTLCSMEIEHISAEDNDFNKFINESLAGNNHLDLVQLPVYCNSQVNLDKLLTSNSQSFNNFIFSDKFTVKDVFQFVPGYAKKVLPVYHNPFVQVVNTEFTSEAFLKEFCNLMSEAPVQAWQKATKELPQDVYLTNHTADISFCQGYVWPVDQNELSKSIGAICDIIETAKSKSKVFSMSINGDYCFGEGIKKLLNEKVFSAYVSSIFLPFLSSHHNKFIIIPGGTSFPGRVNFTGEVALGVCPGNKNRSYIEDFGRYLLSEEVQKKAVHELNVVPFNRKAVECFNDFFYCQEKSKNIDIEYSLFSREMDYFHFRHNIQLIWNEVLYNALPKSEAIERILNIFMQE